MTPEEIIDRAFQPDYDSEGPDAGYLDRGYTIGYATQPICGDIVKVFVKFQEVVRGGVSGLVIEDARHQTQACTLTTAAADIMCEILIGKNADFKINLIEVLGIPVGVNRRQCVLCPWNAFLETLK
jgi:NifU-like protein involved in Fe-S cluster formation